MKELLLTGYIFARNNILLRITSLKRRFKIARFFQCPSRSSTKTTSADLLLSNESEPSRTTLPFSFSAYLREPLAVAIPLLKANQTYLEKIERQRNCFLPVKRLKPYIDNFSVTQHHQFLELQRSDPRSRIMASFHFGDFLYGLNKLIALQPDHVTSRVLSQSEYSKPFIDNMKRGFGRKAPLAESQIMLQGLKIQKLTAFLREPDSLLLMFADLPRAYGETIGATFLGRIAWFPKGIAVLALTSRVPVLPVICYWQNNQNCIELGQQIEPIRLKNESKEAAVQRITQRLVEFFEYFFRQHQEQWRYLSALPNYFSDPDGDVLSDK